LLELKRIEDLVRMTEMTFHCHVRGVKAGSCWRVYGAQDLLVRRVGIQEASLARQMKPVILGVISIMATDQ
jgi:hypothetical protein